MQTLLGHADSKTTQGDANLSMARAQEASNDGAFHRRVSMGLGGLRPLSDLGDLNEWSPVARLGPALYPAGTGAYLLKCPRARVRIIVRPEPSSRL